MSSEPLTAQAAKQFFKEVLGESMKPVVQRLVVLEIKVAVESAKAANSRTTLSEQLTPVPLADGCAPELFPESIRQLVPGAGAGAAEWSTETLLKAIRQYEPEYDPQQEDEGYARWQHQRLAWKFCRHIGLTNRQLAEAYI